MLQITKKHVAILFLILTGISFISCMQESQVGKEIKNRPNVVYINVDDLG